MFTLLSKLTEILTQFGAAFIARKRTADDAGVAEVLLRCVVALQDLCVAGEKILHLAGKLLDGGAPGEFAALVDQQRAAIETLRSDLDRGRTLLATVDPDLYPELAPFLDQKSGLLAEWAQQAAEGRFSTTTLFYLPAETLDRVIAAGKNVADAEGLHYDRLGYVEILADGLWAAQSREIRDLRRPVTESRIVGVREEITAARAGLDRVRTLSGQLMSTTREAVGEEAMAELRRSLARG